MPVAVPAAGVPRLAAGAAATGQVVLPPAAYLLLCHVDGSTTVDELAAASGLPLDVAAGAVSELMSCGLVELDQERAAPVTAPAPAPEPSDDEVAASVRRVSRTLLEAFAAPEPVADVVDFAAARREALRREVTDHVDAEAGRRAGDGDAVRREAESRREVEALRRELEAARREAADLRREAGDARGMHDAVRGECEALQTELQQMRAERDALRAELEAAGSTAVDVDAEVARALADARSEAARLVADGRAEAAWIVEEAGVRLHEARRADPGRGEQPGSPPPTSAPLAVPAPVVEPDPDPALLAVLADLSADPADPPVAPASTPVPPSAPRGELPPPGDFFAPPAHPGAPAPYVARDQADMSALLRELSSLGVEDAPMPALPSSAAPTRPVAATTTTPAAARKRKGLFGR